MVVYTSFKATHLQVFVEGFSLESYRKVFSTAIQSITNTYLYCLVAILVIVVLGMLIAYLAVRRKSWLTNLIDTIAMFPYIVPGSVLGITLLVAFNHQPLMLAGSVIAQVFNTLGAIPGNIVIFLIISFAGNTLNFALNLLGCYVHDLRLQCLEYFGKFYQDGGKPFRPLNLNTKYYEVVK